MPLTLAVVFFIMLDTGRFFDRITLGALILALGLLVDDAIIAIEVMVVKMEEGMDRIKAAAYAWSHTAAPMLSGTLVTIAGFLPVGFARSTAAIKQQFFPTSDRPEVLVEVRLPEGTSIATTAAAVDTLEDWLDSQPEALTVTSYVGQGAPRFFFAMAPELPDPAFAKIVVLTPDADHAAIARSSRPRCNGHGR